MFFWKEFAPINRIYLILTRMSPGIEGEEIENKLGSPRSGDFGSHNSEGKYDNKRHPHQEIAR
jgi:hypothetical protein